MFICNVLFVKIILFSCVLLLFYVCLVSICSLCFCNELSDYSIYIPIVCRIFFRISFLNLILSCILYFYFVSSHICYILSIHIAYLVCWDSDISQICSLSPFAASLYFIYDSSSSSCHQTILFHSSAHCFPTSLNIIRSSNSTHTIIRSLSHNHHN